MLRWIGLDAAEVVLDRLLEGEAAGVRGFYYDVLGGMPGVYPLVIPLLASPRPHEVRHGAALLGRLGQPAGIDELVPLMTHRDEAVRVAGVRAIGEIHEGSGGGAAAAGAAPSRSAHPGRGRRGDRGVAGGALALLLVAALETERDRDAWQALVTALGRLGTVESCAALAGVALTRRSLLRRQGYSTGQRLAAVEALGLTDARRARDPRAPGARRRRRRALRRRPDGVEAYAADQRAPRRAPARRLRSAMHVEPVDVQVEVVIDPHSHGAVRVRSPSASSV